VITTSVLAVVAAVFGSSAVTALVTAWVTRDKTVADTQAVENNNALTLATSAIERMTAAEKKIDQMEQDWRDMRRSVFPHQSWDVKAHRLAIQVDPDFPPPPDIVI
jgi:TolA-binding protein